MAAMTAREFNQSTGVAKRIAREEPLFVTERGTVQYVLLNIDDYNRLKGSVQTLKDLPGMSEEAYFDFEFERIQSYPREVDFS